MIPSLVYTSLDFGLFRVVRPYLKMNVWYYFVDLRLASKSKFLSKTKVKNKMVARYFKVKYDFQQMKLGANVIPHFHVILTGQFISCIICMIQGHLQG